MSADRTLMSVIRTSLLLITFGFTIHQVFEKLREQAVLTRTAPVRNFGVALVGLGIVMLAVGIIYHMQFMRGLRKERKAMVAEPLRDCRRLRLLRGRSHDDERERQQLFA
jgi:putative membrane protein